MKLMEFKKIIDEAVKYAGKAAKNADIEVAYKKTCYEIRSVSQGNIIPEVLIEIGEKTYIDPFFEIDSEKQNTY